MDPRKNRAFRLRNLTVDELQKTLDEHKKELVSLRVNKVASGVASKLAKIKVVRKAIARQLTILNQKRRNELKETFATRAGIKKYNEENKTNFSLNRKPKELKARLTRALRKKISKRQASKLLPKQQKRLNAFPQRVYAVKA
jgi:large subunit ribosomal protein L35e